MQIKERRTVLVPIEIKAYCDQCGTGLGEAVLLPNSVLQGNTMALSEKTMYMYTCPKCGETIISETFYPKIEYKEI